MLFCKFLVTAVAMAILFVYCFPNCDFVYTWEHFLVFLGFKNLFVGSLHSKPLHGLELISFLAIPGATLFFYFLDPYINIFVGSLYSIPLHRLEPLIFGNTLQQLLSWQHFFCFFYLYINIFVGSSLHSKPQHRLELISFSTLPGNKCCHGYTNVFLSVSFTLYTFYLL